MISALEKLIKVFSLMDGIGNKSAKRIALNLIKDKNNLMINLSMVLKDLYENLKVCNKCYNLDVNPICYICTDDQRDKDKLCIVEDIRACFKR